MVKRITADLLRGVVQTKGVLSRAKEEFSREDVRKDGESAREDMRTEEELSGLRGELRLAQRDLSAAYRTFDLVTDPDLIESWVYRISAAQAHYHYLLRAIRSCDVLPPE